MNEFFKEKLKLIKEKIETVDSLNPINEKYETNHYFYVKKIVDYIEANPTHTYYPQKLICEDILEGCDVEISISVCNILKEYRIFDINFLHNSYDDCDHEVEHEMEQNEFIAAMHDPSYTPINLHTGDPVEYYMPKWISFSCYTNPNATVVEGLDF